MEVLMINWAEKLNFKKHVDIEEAPVQVFQLIQLSGHHENSDARLLPLIQTSDWMRFVN